MDKRAAELDVQFPAAVRELYSIEGLYKIFKRYSDCDRLLEPFELERKVPRNPMHEEIRGKAYFKPNFFTFFYENEGVYELAFELDGSDDPPVWFEGDGPYDYSYRDRKKSWIKVDDHFSSFFFNWVWSHLYYNFGLTIVGTSDKFTADDLSFLQSALREVKPLFDNLHHFEGADSHLQISRYYDADEFVWWLDADSANAIYKLAKIVVQCSCFKDTKFDTFHTQSLSDQAEEEAEIVFARLIEEEKSK
ncbi:MAG: hypothetical protein J0I20_03275 [Chloroflexi bacterium]|nr:hypothetical protein [Chloroflexota bacterium]